MSPAEAPPAERGHTKCRRPAQLGSDDTVHELNAGDCLQLGAPAPCSFSNPTGEPCRYLVALTKRQA